MIRLRLNGAEVAYDGPPERPILRWLRDEARVTSVKDGCSPQAACGACTVELDGKAVLSCVTPMEKADGKELLTLDGLDQAAKDAFVAGFRKCGGVQCGFCIPGIVTRARNLLRKTPEPSHDEVARGLSQHLCRCTGYKKIIAAIVEAGKQLLGKGSPAQTHDGKVGSRLPKYGIEDLVLGRRKFAGDLFVPGMRHAALRLSDHPRAKVLKIDASAALKAPGVERVLTAADVPGTRIVGLIVKDWPVLVAPGETTGYIGDALAIVVAATREQARAAAKLVKVEYEVLEPVLDLFKALEPGAPRVGPKGNRLSLSVAKKGDAGKALSECDHVVEAVYQTQVIEHAYIETEAALAVPEDDGRLTVYSQGQGVYEDRAQLCALLNLPPEKINVVLCPSGGGFGGKEDLLAQGHAALAAFALKAPVKLELTREESILMHPKRHALRLEFRLGCGRDGKLKALRARIYGDSGAYASVGMKVLERAAGHATGGYFVPNVDLEAVAVYTNNIPCGAMRGFGANQATFAMECAVDELCEKGGFDRWQFRWDNALTEGLSTSTGQLLTGGVGVRACLEAVKDAFRGAKHAGLACGIKNTGIGNGMPDFSEVELEVLGPDLVEIRHGWTEMGQGVDTVAISVACEETGLPPEAFSVRVRTEHEARSGMTTASRATSLVGNAMIDASRKLKADLNGTGLKGLVGRRYRGRWICDWTNKPGHEDGKPPFTHYSYSYAAQVAIVGDDGEVSELIAAHDAGRIMNRTLFEGQIEGALHMGLGYAISEELPLEGGRPKSTRLRDCGVLRARQTPKLTVIGVEVKDPLGPYGAKGVGEIGLVPTAGAVANALWAFDGKRRRTLPMKRR